MSTRPDPEASSTVEIATRRCPRLRVVWDFRLEIIHSTDRCLQSPSDLNFCRVCWVQYDRCSGSSRTQCYGLHLPWLEAEAGDEHQHYTREVDVRCCLG